MTLTDLCAAVAVYTRARRSRILCIDGHLCSGKTTFADCIADHFSQTNTSTSRFNIDWFLADRDHRNYLQHPTLFHLANWFDLSAAAQAIPYFAGMAGESELKSICAYDRATGKRTKNIRVTPVPAGSLLIAEGIYSRLVLHNACIEPDISIMFRVQNTVARRRMLARNTYINIERLLFEMDNIYFPSLTDYEDLIKAKRLSYEIEVVTDDFGNVSVSTQLSDLRRSNDAK